MIAPLDGLTVSGTEPDLGRGGAGRPGAVAARAADWLKALGARPGAVRPGADELVVAGGGRRGLCRVVQSPGAGAGVEAGMPADTFALALSYALAGGALVAWWADTEVDLDPLGLALLIHLPAVMAASYGSDWWPTPPPPRPAPGGGWVCAELGAPGDEEDWDRLLSCLPGRPDAEELAAAAQSWRLPVCPYRPHPSRRPDRPSVGAGEPISGAGPVRVASPPGPGHTDQVPPARTGGGAPLSGVVVADLTSVWAGPLATWLLARLGAWVRKVEPAARPDGTRALNGRGIHPNGASRHPGADSALFNALANTKERLDLDANQPEQAHQLRAEVAGADLVVDSFSPRVMGQLGLDRASLGPSHPASHLSLPAFPAGPWRHWVAYGTGIHALCGLGDQPGGYRAPAVTYPDPLAGLAGFLGGVSGLVARDLGRTHDIEVALWSATQPLVAGPPRPCAEADPDLGSRLLEAAGSQGLLAAVADGAGTHLYPVGFLSGPWTAPPLRPAPGWPE